MIKIEFTTNCKIFKLDYFMTRRTHIRRVGILCCHCLRNLAFYSAGEHNERISGQFWINAFGNFLDIAVLEWCKLFGDKRGKHYWGEVVTDKSAFLEGLLEVVTLTKDCFDVYIDAMRIYRDKHVAHLDLVDPKSYPNICVALRSTVYLYDYLRAHEDEGGFFADAPDSASAFYKKFLEEGLKSWP